MAKRKNKPMPDVRATDSFAGLAGAKYVLLTTFKRDGRPVPTPMWSAVEDGVVYLSTAQEAGKLKRLRNERRTTVSSCTARGKPTGPTFAATAEVLSGKRSHQAHQRILAHHRWARPFYFVGKLIRPRKGLVMVGLRAVPAPVVDLPEPPTDPS